MRPLTLRLASPDDRFLREVSDNRSWNIVTFFLTSDEMDRRNDGDEILSDLVTKSFFISLTKRFQFTVSRGAPPYAGS